MNIFEQLKEIGMFEQNATMENALSYFYAHRIYLHDFVEETKIPKELRDKAEVFMENDSEYDGDELSAWKRFLSTN